MDPIRNDQYNTIKHGFRSQLGGVRLQIGTPLPDGGSPTAGHFHNLGGSEFGTCFFALESLGTKHQFKLKQVARNWSPDTLACRLQLITFSLKNIIAFLWAENRIGKPVKHNFGWPDDEIFERALRLASGVISMTLPSRKIDPEDVSPLTKDEILAVYAPPGVGSPNPMPTPEAAVE